MSTSCSTSATATQTELHTTESLSTSFSLSVGSETPTTSTVTFTTCPTPDAPSSSCETTTSITTIPGGTTTTSVPVVITVPITSTSLTTLFDSSCTVITTPPVTTPTPTVITSESSSTLPNGSVSVGTVTVTTMIPQTDAPSEPTQQSNDHSSSDSTNLGAIIGGVIGGVFGIAALVLVFWFVHKRRTKWDDIFDKEDDRIVAVTGSRYNSGGIDEPTLPDVGTLETLEPKPYEYGNVGNTTSPTHSLQPSTGTGYTGTAVRPSSTGSMQPLSPPGIGLVMGLGHPAHTSTLLSPQQQQQFQQPFVNPNNANMNNNGRPTSMHSASSHGGHSLSPSHSGYGSGYGSGQGSPPMMSPAMSPGAWSPTGQLDGQFNPGIGGFVPVQQSANDFFTAHGQRQNQGQGQLQRPHTSPTPPASTHGSGISGTASDSYQYQQQGRKLHVTNVAAEESPAPNLQFIQGASNGAARPSSSQSNPALSEKQRLAMDHDGSNGRGVLVHQDGGKVVETGQGQGQGSSGQRQEQSESEAGPPPPAYEE